MMASLRSKNTERDAEKAAEYHSIIFRKKVSGDVLDSNETNSWTTWRLIPVSRPDIVLPQPLYKYVDIPGKNGQLDISTYLTGKITYGNRTGSLQFFVYRDKSDVGSQEWNIRKLNLASYFDGSVFYMILEDAPKSYYIGRLFFSAWSTGPQFSQVTIDYNLRPFRYKTTVNKSDGVRQYYADEVGL